MKRLLLLCALSVAVMHFNRDLSPMFWAGFAAFAVSIITLACRMDNEDGGGIGAGAR